MCQSVSNVTAVSCRELLARFLSLLQSAREAAAASNASKQSGIEDEQCEFNQQLHFLDAQLANP